MNKKTYSIMSILIALVFAINGYYGVRASSVTAPVMAGSIYYVSATGNDANTCSQSTPCKTITRGITVAQNGDTIMVSAGVYHEYVYVNKSITIFSNGAVMDGTNATGQLRDGLFSVFADNVKVSGFTIINAANYGLANFGNNNQFTNNVIHNTKGPGIWMRDGKFNIFENNELYYTVLQNSVSFDGTYYTCSPTIVGWPSAINSWGAAGSNTWRGNYIHDNCGEGIAAYTGDLVENNTFKNNWSVEIYIDGNTDVTVRNNVITNTRPYFARGSNQSWRQVPYGVAVADETGCLADRNTITGNTISNVRLGFSFYSYTACSGLKNTVIESNTITNAWEYGLRITTGAHANSIIRNNTIQLTSGNPLSIQNGSVLTLTGNAFSSNVNVFEWNGSTYNFAGWSALVPSNFWGTTGVTATASSIPLATLTATKAPTSTATVVTTAPTGNPSSPTPTQTVVLPPMTATPTVTQTVVQPTMTTSPVMASPTPTQVVVMPTATLAPSQPPISGITYDDQDSAFIYSTGWQDAPASQAYNNSYKITTDRRASVTLNFAGQSFSILYTSDLNFRGMDVYVDNVVVGTIDQKAPQTGYQQSWTYSGLLTPGAHTLKLIAKNKGGTSASLDAVIIQ